MAAEARGRRLVIPVPAAAVEPARGHRLCNLQGRLRRLLERSGDRHSARLAGRLLPARILERSGGSQTSSLPEAGEGAFHWLLIADWLAESFGLSSAAAGRAVLDDLCWIQYCVYGLFRAQDDLVDGDMRDPLLAVETNQLLVEATRCAARHFEGGSPFWDVFHETIDATSRAIVALDPLQRSPERDPEAEIDLYADLGACLKICAAGVALEAGRGSDWRNAISPAFDHIAIAGQILDDVHDIQTDLADGRINHAAWYLGRPVFGSTPEAIEAVVASNLATTRRLDELLARARGHLKEAAGLIGTEICGLTHAYLVDYDGGIVSLAKQFEQSRQALLFDCATDESTPRVPGPTLPAR